MYDVVSLVFEIYYAIFCGYCLQYFYGSFLEYKRRERRWNGLYVAVSYALLRLCVNLLQPSDYGDIRTMGNLIITLMAVTQISLFIAHSIYELGAGLRISHNSI